MLGINDAAHEETTPDGGRLVISKLACSLVGQAHPVKLVPGSRVHEAYGRDEVVEQFRCSYGLNPAYRETIGGRPLRVVGTDAEGNVRAVEIPDHRFYVATLYLPQLRSSPDAPHPLIAAYLKAALTKEQYGAISGQDYL